MFFIIANILIRYLQIFFIYFFNKKKNQRKDKKKKLQIYIIKLRRKIN